MNLYYCNVRFIGDGVVQIFADSLEEAQEKLNNGDYELVEQETYDHEPNGKLMEMGK